MKKLFAVFMVFLFFISCGVEDYKYLEPLTDIVTENVTRATLRTPDSDETYTIEFPNYGVYPRISSTDIFSGYTIYYKIYKSDHLSTIVNTDAELKAVNDTLLSDYTVLKPYTDINNNNTASMDSLFTNKRFYPLSYDVSNNLMRSNNSNAFTLNPDGYFINTYDLRTTTPTQVENWDVIDTTKEKNYTYAAMYIVRVDFNPQTLTPIYSNPSFINVFLLPEPIVLVPLTGIAILPSAAIITGMGNIAEPYITSAQTYKLSVTLQPTNASVPTTTWASSMPSVATVDNTGLVTRVIAGAGTVKITATAITADSTTFTADCYVQFAP